MIVQDSFGSLMPGQYDGAPVMMFGCHWNQMDGGSLTSPAKFDHHNKVGRDQSWKRTNHNFSSLKAATIEAFCDFQYHRYQTRHFENFLIFIPKMV